MARTGFACLFALATLAGCSGAFAQTSAPATADLPPIADPTSAAPAPAKAHRAKTAHNKSAHRNKTDAVAVAPAKAASGSGEIGSPESREAWRKKFFSSDWDQSAGAKGSSGPDAPPVTLNSDGGGITPGMNMKF